MTNENESKVNWNRNIGFMVFFLLMGIVLFNDATSIIATSTSYQNKTIISEKETASTTEPTMVINNIRNIYNGTSDCVAQPSVYDYKALAKSVRESKCFKDFLSEFPNDFQTSKIKSVSIDLMCSKGVTKGMVYGKIYQFKFGDR